MARVLELITEKSDHLQFVILTCHPGRYLEFPDLPCQHMDELECQFRRRPRKPIMRKDGARFRFSPSDLINFMGSEFVTWMDRFYKECPGEIEPDPDTEEQKIIQDKGLEHERSFLDGWRHKASGCAI